MLGRNGIFTHAFSESSSKPYAKNGLTRMDTLHRLRAKSSCLCEVQSLAQALQDRTQQCWVGAALHADHRPARELDVNRPAWRRLFLRTSRNYLVGCLTRSRQRTRKKRRRSSNRLDQSAPL